jgi:hypothetical protein
VSIKFLRLFSFGGLYVRAIGFENDHVKHDGEGLHYHHAHAAMVMTFEAKDAQHGALKDFKMKTTRTSPDRWTRRIMMSSICVANPQQEKIRYIWILRSSLKYSFQRIKRQGNRRFLQVDMAQSPMVAHAEILDSKQCLCKTTIAPSFGLRLRQMRTRCKDNFINFSIELYFGICSILYAGVNPRRRVSNKAMTTR